MGGWYLQPDCNMPQGESIVRQIQVGHRYFREKFGVEPTTAINFDPFGHSRGLVQVIKKCGQDSYIICRGGTDPLPSNEFWWEGFDGSQIKVKILPDYRSALGRAVSRIKEKIDPQKGDIALALWGVGNHGGGPSRKDLQDITKFIAESDMKIIHSTPEKYFSVFNPTDVHDKSLRLSMPGYYTSQARIKQKHAELENKLYATEKICTVAAVKGLIKYPEREIDDATEDLLNSEFHDIIPGSSIRPGEENGIRLLEHGLLTLNRAYSRAYFALTSEEAASDEGEYPILIFNPHPYELTTDIVCEFTAAEQNWREDVEYKFTVKDENGNNLPMQMLKEESNINIDWQKRIAFRASLKPLALTRCSIYSEVIPKPEKIPFATEGDIVIDIPEISKKVVIDRKTGLMTSYCINDKEYIAEGGAFSPVMCDDNPDPWRSDNCSDGELGKNPVPFTLMGIPDGPFNPGASVRITEDGEVFTSVEAFFICAATRARVEYIIYKNDPAVDVKVDIFMNNADKMVRLALPLTLYGEYIGQTVFGTEPLYKDGRECVAQRFTALCDENGEKCAVLLNRGTYGSSFKDGVLSMTLVRGAAYSALPIGERPIVPIDKYVKRIDMGERNFEFRFTVADMKSLDRLAQEFNQRPYACNVFPVESGIKANVEFSLEYSDKDIILSALKKKAGSDNEYVIRLYNGSDCSKNVVFSFGDDNVELTFGKFEVKTLVYSENKLSESEMMII